MKHKTKKPLEEPKTAQHWTRTVFSATVVQAVAASIIAALLLVLTVGDMNSRAGTHEAIIILAKDVQHNNELIQDMAKRNKKVEKLEEKIFELTYRVDQLEAKHKIQKP